MSTVLIKEYTENIIDLIPKVVEEPIQSPRYRSKYNKKPTILKGEDLINTDFEKDKSKEPQKFVNRTFGVPCIPKTPPTQFLKKKSRIIPPRPDIKHVHYKRPGYPKSLPAWVPIKRVVKNLNCHLPESPEDPTITARKNFKLQNIVNVKRSRPQEPKKRFVDTRFGSVHDLESSGLLPIYIHKKDYGKIPNFLPKNPKEVKANSEKIIQPLCRYITAPERAALLQGMKKKWDEMEKEFQCLPFVIDTLPRVTRKTRMEETLKQLEKDINIIEKHPYIYIYSDSEED